MSFEIILKPETIDFPNGTIYFEINGCAVPNLDHRDRIYNLLPEWIVAVRSTLKEPSQSTQLKLTDSALTIERINDYQYQVRVCNHSTTVPIQDLISKLLEATRLALQKAGLCTIQHPQIDALKIQAQMLAQECVHPEDMQLITDGIAAIDRFEDLGFPEDHIPDWVLGDPDFKTNGRIQSVELNSLQIENELTEENHHAELKRIFLRARDIHQQLLKEASPKVFVDRAQNLESDWILCPKCNKAWEAKLSGIDLVECPKCQTLWRHPNCLEMV